MTSPSDQVAVSGSRALACPRCGAAFSCDLSSRCWCADETLKLPMPTGDEDCLCPNCLREAAARAATSP